jgi:ABC-2 type transport system ATP-binding protein
VLAGLVAPITPARASEAVNVTIPFGGRSAVVLGAPRMTVTYRGTTPLGPRPSRVFAQLVDPATGLVLGNQVTPVDVTLDGHTHTVSVPLEMVAFTGKPRGSVDLQLVATTVAYAVPRLGGSVDFVHIGVSLPVASGITAS